MFETDNIEQTPSSLKRYLGFCNLLYNYSAPVGVQNIAINPSVCVCLSVREHISGTAEPIGTKFCVRIPCGRVSVLLWRRCVTLCTSGLWTTSRSAVMGAPTARVDSTQRRRSITCSTGAEFVVSECLFITC